MTRALLHILQWTVLSAICFDEGERMADETFFLDVSVQSASAAAPEMKRLRFAASDDLPSAARAFAQHHELRAEAGCDRVCIEQRLVRAMQHKLARLAAQRNSTSFAAEDPHDVCSALLAKSDADDGTGVPPAVLWYSRSRLRARMRAIAHAADNVRAGGGSKDGGRGDAASGTTLPLALFAVKSFPHYLVLRTALEAHLGFDVSNGRELRAVHEAVRGNWNASSGSDTLCSGQTKTCDDTDTGKKIVPPMLWHTDPQFSWTVAEVRGSACLCDAQHPLSEQQRSQQHDAPLRVQTPCCCGGDAPRIFSVESSDAMEKLSRFGGTLMRGAPLSALSRGLNCSAPAFALRLDTHMLLGARRSDDQSEANETRLPPSRFGLAPYASALMPLLRQAAHTGLQFAGFHLHHGGESNTPPLYARAVRRVLRLGARLGLDMGISGRVALDKNLWLRVRRPLLLNIGGGQHLGGAWADVARSGSEAAYEADLHAPAAAFLAELSGTMQKTLRNVQVGGINGEQPAAVRPARGPWQLVVEPGRLYSEHTGFACAKIMSATPRWAMLPLPLPNTAGTFEARVSTLAPVRAYTVALSHFLHTIWERPYVLDPGLDPHHIKGGRSHQTQKGDKTQQHVSAGVAVAHPSIVFGSSCYEGDRFRLRRRMKNPAAERKNEITANGAHSAWPWADEVGRARIVEHVSDIRNQQMLASALSDAIELRPRRVGEILVLGGLSGYAHGLNHGFNGIAAAAVHFCA